ncbi:MULTISPECIES: hypothetical protein [Gammaproteobacteria]|uniref:hypothetical protein n=1 Tax=Gammaproteobacteria TaxID=1236 RepID=UPI000DCFF77B|nr:MULTISPECIES: hypothetical protein [Gammaproteobacteria]RTE85540.1 hypothetical protein DQX04_11615 [Aliidiomarina sp. B3213]TCZ89510.1 hypothetical protein EYQ95_11545 [Lysobacter sp. N42]
MLARNLFKLSAVAMALALSACGGDIVINAGGEQNPGGDGGSGGGGGGTPVEGDCPSWATEGDAISGQNLPVCEITGTLTQDRTLTNDILWALDGRVAVGNDEADSTVLSIEAGTTLFGKSGADFLVVRRGSQIMAEGTQNSPIVMTSLQNLLGTATGTDSGQWGGLVLLGRAPSNRCEDLSACSIEAEGDAGPYGGNLEDDNSGVLRYVQVRYAGYEVLPDNELNGITFAGVGSGTTVEHIQVYNNLDDGIEFFGGTVSAKYVVLMGNQDDSLDWDAGWNGRLQHVLIKHNPYNAKANRGIEADNSSADFNATPRSRPVISNLTILTNEWDGDDDAEGILLRRGTSAELHNVIIAGEPGTGECFELNDDATVANANSNDMQFTHSIISCSEPFKATVDANDNVTFDAEAWFLGQEGNSTVDPLLGDYMPSAVSPALGAGVNVANQVDNWFDEVDYIGAFDGTTDWTEGWTYGLHNTVDAMSCPSGTTQIQSITGRLNCELNGTYTQDVHLQVGADYVLDGLVRIGNDNADNSTLYIDPGVTIFGQGGADFLVIARGSKISAEGRPNAPIVMTSLQDVIGANTSSGQWGGLVLLGNGVSNKCDQAAPENCAIEAEGDAGPYGGGIEDDNSGKMKFVRVQHAGYEVLPDNELNGITFAGIGSGTRLSFLQVHQNLDDGIEFFGGSANVRYMVTTAIGDDSLDWADGWNGKVQFMLVKHDGEANRGIEADNQSGNFTATPISNPTVANMTIIGNDYTSADKDSEGVLLRAGTTAKLYNFVITGPAGMGECLEFNSDESMALAADFTTEMTHSLVACDEPFKGDVSATQTTEQWFLAQEGNQTAATMAEAVNGIFTIFDTTARDVSQDDDFFVNVPFIGAVTEDYNWTQGWTVGLESN